MHQDHEQKSTTKKTERKGCPRTLNQRISMGEEDEAKRGNRANTAPAGQRKRDRKILSLGYMVEIGGFEPPTSGL
jgi:hypothetical protein